MNEQLLITWILIGLAGTYLSYRVWRIWQGTKSGACAGGCGCAKTRRPVASEQLPLISSDQLVLRQRPRQSSGD